MTHSLQSHIYLKTQQSLARINQELPPVDSMALIEKELVLIPPRKIGSKPYADVKSI